MISFYLSRSSYKTGFLRYTSVLISSLFLWWCALKVKLIVSFNGQSSLLRDTVFSNITKVSKKPESINPLRSFVVCIKLEESCFLGRFVDRLCILIYDNESSNHCQDISETPGLRSLFIQVFTFHQSLWRTS